MDEPGHRNGLPGWLDDHHSRPGAVDDVQAVTFGSGAGHAGYDRGDLLGRRGAGGGNSPRQAGGWTRLHRADRLRAIRAARSGALGWHCYAGPLTTARVTTDG